MKCSRHPQVETYLTCGRCGTPICPRCMVQTPVWARCPTCAHPRRLPTFEVSFTQYLKALGAGLGLGVGGGLLWAFLPLFGLLSFLVALGLGYGIGEAVSVIVNRKRSRGLQVIAGSSVITAFLVASFFHGGFFFLLSFYSLLALALGVYVATSRIG